jgi:hypothetical protein
MAETTIAGIQPALPYYALTPHKELGIIIKRVLKIIAIEMGHSCPYLFRYPPAGIRTGNFHCIRLEQILESHSGIRLMRTYPHEPTPPFLT